MTACNLLANSSDYFFVCLFHVRAGNMVATEKFVCADDEDNHAFSLNVFRKCVFVRLRPSKIVHSNTKRFT